MPYFSSSIDSAQLCYRDYVPNQNPVSSATVEEQDSRNDFPVLVFLHGWPMSSAMYEQLMLVLCEKHHMRCVAQDRRGFGKSDWSGIQRAPQEHSVTYEVFADDTIQLVEMLKLKRFYVVAASMGCGESLLAFQRSKFVQENCQGLLWIGPSLPFPLRTEENPEAPPKELWDSIADGLCQNRASFVHASLPNVFGAHVGVELDQSTLERFERIVDDADGLAIQRCITIITEFDFTDSLKQFNSKEIPLMILHGDSDKGMPYVASTKLVEELVPRAEGKVYKTAGHGLYLTHANQVVDDLLRFIQSSTIGKSSLKK